MSHYTIEISANKIIINGKDTGLLLSTRETKKVIYRPENKVTGQAYCQVELPGKRYALPHTPAAPGTSGWNELARDAMKAMKVFGVTAPSDIAAGQFTFQLSITWPHP